MKKIFFFNFRFFAIIFTLVGSIGLPRVVFAQNVLGSSYTQSDIVWQDDFDGNELDSSSWSLETHGAGWVNSELQRYEASEKNVYVKNGCLVIQALKDKNGYTSARINTYGKHNFKYGRFEARIKVPSGKGFLPAFWLMPANDSTYGKWPKSGEIDIMEVLGSDTKKTHGTLHFGEPHTQSQGSYVLPKGDFSKDFHVYAVEWESEEIRWYVDGNLFYKTSEWFSKPATADKKPYPAPFDRHFYIILNLAVGGDWPGNPDMFSNFYMTKLKSKARLLVDYIKVYQKK